MATGNTVIYQLANVNTAPTQGNCALCVVSFGGEAVLQACSNFYIEVILSDPTNTGTPAVFEVQLYGGIQGADNEIGSPITAPGLYTVTSSSPVTEWTADLLSLSGGTDPHISVNGVAGE